MMDISALRDDLDAALREDDLVSIRTLVYDLWDKCYWELMHRRISLRDTVGELYSFSNMVLRSVEDE